MAVSLLHQIVPLCCISPATEWLFVLRTDKASANSHLGHMHARTHADIHGTRRVAPGVSDNDVSAKPPKNFDAEPLTVDKLSLSLMQTLCFTVCLILLD